MTEENKTYKDQQWDNKVNWALSRAGMFPEMFKNEKGQLVAEFSDGTQYSVSGADKNGRGGTYRKIRGSDRVEARKARREAKNGK